MKDSRQVFNWEVRTASTAYPQRREKACDEGCELSSDCALAMAYVPQQKWQKIYSSEIGFTRGTIFEELEKPFLGRNDC